MPLHFNWRAELHLQTLDDRDLFVEVAGEMGMQGIHHTGFESTQAALTALGLSLTD